MHQRRQSDSVPISTCICQHGRFTYLLREFDNLCRLSNGFLPEEDNVPRLAGIRRQWYSGILLFLYKLVPNSNINLSTDAFGYLAPVHVPACLLYSPDDGAQAGHALTEFGKRHRACLGDEGIGFRLKKEFGKGLVWLVVWDQDRRKVEEGTRKECREELETVGEVDGHSLSTAILKMLSENSDLLGNIFNFVLGDTFLSKDGHDVCSAARLCALLERDLACDTSPDIPEISIFAGRVHGSARGSYGKTGTERVCCMLAGTSANIGWGARTAMRSFGGAEDRRLSRLPHV